MFSCCFFFSCADEDAHHTLSAQAQSSLCARAIENVRTGHTGTQYVPSRLKITLAFFGPSFASFFFLDGVCALYVGRTIRFTVLVREARGKSAHPIASKATSTPTLPPET